MQGVKMTADIRVQRLALSADIRIRSDQMLAGPYGTMVLDDHGAP